MAGAIASMLIIATHAIAAPANSSPTPIPPPSGMVSWWPGDGNANDIVDGNPGTMVNGATFSAGKVAQAFSFDGVDDYVNVSNSLNLNPGFSDFTVDFWMRTTYKGTSSYEKFLDLVGKRDFCGYSSFYNLRLTGDGTIWTEVDNGPPPYWFASFGATPVNDGVWHLIAFVRKGTTVTLYIDGTVETTYSTAGVGVLYISNGAPLRFGYGPCAGADPAHNGYFVGDLDEIEYFNVALTQSQVQALFTADSAGKDKGTPTPNAQTQIANLVSTVNDLLPLNSGEKNSLISKLNAASASVDRSNSNSACGQMNAFINEVNALIRSSRLTPATGNDLVSQAQSIKTSIGCPK